MSGVNEAQMQNRIQAIIEDWMLSDGETRQLETIKHRIMQRHPGEDVTMDEIDRIVTQPTSDASFKDGFSRSELKDLLFNV
jgi:hypothetical protein